MQLKYKIVALGILPLILAVSVICALVIVQNQRLGEQQAQLIEDSILASKRAELKNYVEMAMSALAPIYDSGRNDEQTKQQVLEELSKLSFGIDGYFFVYKLDGTNIVHPKLAHLVGLKLWDLQHPESDLGIRNLMEASRRGGGFQEYIWQKPSTGLVEEKLSYGVLLSKWGWMLGTGLYIDDIAKEVEATRTEFAASVRKTVVAISGITFVAILIAGALIVAVRFSEQRFADSKLKELNQRIFDAQEQERKRVSTELHDSISQLLVSVRYGIEMIQSEASESSPFRGYAVKCLKTLDGAISEVRRISRDLRPSILDDMGLATALKSLGTEFQSQSGITVKVSAERSHDRLSDGAKTALYRVVQECMTNVARHSEATEVAISLSIGRDSLLLTVQDNGVGIPTLPIKTGGLGIRNMRERIETHNGTIQLLPRVGGGTLIRVTMPIETPIKKAA